MPARTDAERPGCIPTQSVRTSVEGRGSEVYLSSIGNRKSTPPLMDRIVIVGTSCSGKTTLARQLAQRLGSVHIEADAIHWLRNWEPRSHEEFQSLMSVAVAAERWVIDGNYSKVRDIVWGRATTIVWLNYPFATVWRRALSRTIRRVVRGEELFSGNRETFRHSFMSRDSILLWVLQTYRSNRIRYRKIFAEKPFPGLEMIELRSLQETRRWVRVSDP